MRPELIAAVHSILADILTEAAYIIEESEELMTIDEAVAQAMTNMAGFVALGDTTQH